MMDRRSLLRGGMATGIGLSSGVTTLGQAWAAYDPAPAPRLPGTYVPPPGSHPFVFATPAKLQAFLDRDGGTFTKARAMLEQRVRSAVKDPTRFTTPFSGCTLDRYLHELTYEYGGAARVAADLATYAYLTSLGRGYGVPQLAAQAQDTAKQILMRWSGEGFRDGGSLRSQISQFCDEKGTSSQAAQFEVGLQVGRGMLNWVHAQDVLAGLNAFSSAETDLINQFVDNLSNVIRLSANKRAKESNPDCNRYSNHVSIGLAALISIARLRGNRKDLEDAAFGAHGEILIPWTKQVNSNIYGPNPHLFTCYQGAAPKVYFELPTVEPGEIIDRFRAGEYQSFGYPMYSLSHLLSGAYVLRSAGFSPFGAIGGRPNPMKSALDYYSGYFIALLSPDLTRVPSDLEYPNSAQYVGKIISTPGGKTIEGADDLLTPFLQGLPIFPKDPALEEVFQKANAFAPQYQAFSGVAGLHYGVLASLPN